MSSYPEYKNYPLKFTNKSGGGVLYLTPPRTRTLRLLGKENSTGPLQLSLGHYCHYSL